jgi:hypothetical protein
MEPGTELISAVCCRGCHTWSIRLEPFPGAVDDVVTQQPPRSWRQPPDWIPQLLTIAPEVAALLDEIYLASNERQSRLLSMGVRAALDHVMIQIVGDTGSFEQKLKLMQEKGHLSDHQRDMLSTVIDAGSAAAHRGFKPPRDLLQEMLVVMESVIRDHYITRPMLAAMKRFIPPKPPRRQPPTGDG